LEGLARQEIEKAKAAVTDGSSDSKWHAETARLAFEKGDYGAAIYDAVYAESTSLAEEELLGESLGAIRQRTARLANYSAEGFWPVLYKSQVKYYSAREDAELASAFRLAAFADALERMQKRIEEEVFREQEVPATGAEGTQPQEGIGVDATASAFITLAVIGALLVLGYEALVVLGGR